MNVRFGKIFVMHPDAAEKIKDIHRLPERDAYVGAVSNNDPEMLAGNYYLWTLPDKSMLFVTGNDIDGFHRYERENDITFKDKPDEVFYQQLAQRAQNFVTEQEAEGREIQYIGAPTLNTLLEDTGKKLRHLTNITVETVSDIFASFQEYWKSR